MEIFSIIMAVLSVVVGVVSTVMADKNNQENIQQANQAREDVQQFNKEEADRANQNTINQYYQLYSPAAKIQQLNQAGLSPGLFYGTAGGGGGSASTAQAASGSAPIPTSINPMAGLMEGILSAAQTTSQIEKNDAEVKNLAKQNNHIDAMIDEIAARIENFQADTGLKIDQQHLIKTQALLTEWQAKNEELDYNFNSDTYEDRKEIMHETLTKIESEIEESQKRIDGMEIDQNQKNKMFELEQNRIIAETTKNICEAAESQARKVNAEIEKAILEAQQKGEIEKVNLLKKQKEIMTQQEKQLKQQVKMNAQQIRYNDWKYSVRYWDQINETMNAIAGVAQNVTNIVRFSAANKPSQQNGYTINY